MNFNDAVKLILQFEGGYSNDSEDPGGETRHGISKKAYPNLDITNLTVDKAVEIYRQDYWLKTKCEWLPYALRLTVFDCAVNQGVDRSIRFLQKSLGITADGQFGPITARAVHDSVDSDVLFKFSSLRLDSYVHSPHWARFGKGWIKRLLEVSIISAYFANGPQKPDVASPDGLQ